MPKSHPSRSSKSGRWPRGRPSIHSTSAARVSRAHFRRGPRAGILSRVGYAVSRVVIARQDSGRTAFNYSGIFGMSLGIAASNLYYPANSINGSVVASRFGTSMMGGAIGNLLSEFWPDLRQGFFHHKHPLG